MPHCTAPPGRAWTLPLHLYQVEFYRVAVERELPYLIIWISCHPFVLAAGKNFNYTALYWYGLSSIIDMLMDDMLQFSTALQWTVCPES